MPHFDINVSIVALVGKVVLVYYPWKEECKCNPHVFVPVEGGRKVHFFMSRHMNLALGVLSTLLEEFTCLPEFVLVSTLVLIRSVRPNRCLGVTLFSYFRFLLVTHKNYGVKRQGNLLLRYYSCVSMSVRQYVSMSVRGMAAVCQYVSTSVHHVT